MQNNNNNKHLILEHKISSIIYIEQYFETVWKCGGTSVSRKKNYEKIIFLYVLNRFDRLILKIIF
jgi:hypothetical protein